MKLNLDVAPKASWRGCAAPVATVANGMTSGIKHELYNRIRAAVAGLARWGGASHDADSGFDRHPIPLKAPQLENSASNEDMSECLVYKCVWSLHYVFY